MKKIQPYLVPILVLLAFGLRLIGAGDRPLDGDEGVVLLIANGNVNHVLAAAARDVHPPLFHLLTSLVLALDGVSRLSLRLVSVLAGTMLVAFGPALARCFKVNALLVTALLAISPSLVYLAQDARMYSLLALLALGSWLLLMKLWDAEAEPFDPPSLQLRQGKPAQGTSLRAKWAGWALVTLLMLLTHHLGWVVLLGEFIATVAWHRSVFGRPWHWIGASTLVAVGYLPILPTTLGQVQGRLAETSLQLGLDQRIIDLVGGFYRLVAGRTFLALTPSHLASLASDQPLRFSLVLVSLVVPFSLAAIGLVHLFKTSRQTFWDWALLVGVPVGVALGVASLADQAPRYLSFISSIVLAVMAVGLRQTWPGWWGKLLAAGLILTIGAGLWTQLLVHDRAPGLDAYAQAIQSDAALRSDPKPSDAVLVRGSFAGGEAAAFNYERAQCAALPSCSDAGAVIQEPPKLEVVDFFASYAAGNLGELRTIRSADRIAELLASFERVWFFDTTYEADPLMGLDPKYTVTLQTLGVDKERQPLKLYLIEKSVR